jgi:hypothetical protein
MHYPNANDTKTSYLFSLYLTNACIRPVNKTDAVPGMCRSSRKGAPIDVQALLQEADLANSVFNKSLTQPSATTTAVTAGAGVISAGGPFMLLVFAITLSTLAYFMNLLCTTAIFLVPLGLFFVSMTLGITGAAWLHTSTNQMKSRLDSIDPQYVRGARIGGLFMGLLWSSVVFLILSFPIAVGGQWMYRRNPKYRPVKHSVNDENYPLV